VSIHAPYTFFYKTTVFTFIFAVFLLTVTDIYTVSKNVPLLACYNFDAREWILIFLGRNVTDNVGNQKTL